MKLGNELMKDYFRKLGLIRISENYRQRGYDASFEEKLGNSQADLVLRKDDETIIMYTEWNNHEKDAENKRFAELHRFAREAGYRFHSILANPPSEQKIVIENIDRLLTDYFIAHPPPRLLELSSRTFIESVSDVVVNEITVVENSFHVVGNAMFDLLLHYDDEESIANFGGKEKEVIPFNFKMNLRYDPARRLTIDSDNIDYDLEIPSYYDGIVL